MCAKPSGAIFVVLFSILCLSNAENAFAQDGIEELRKQVENLERKIGRNRRSAQKSQTALQRVKEKLTIHGFLSAGVAKHNDDSATLLNDVVDITDELNFQHDSNFGLQISARLNEQFRVVTQLTSELGDDEEVDAKWAYLDYKTLDDHWNIKLGRSLVPLYYYSDFEEVGFAYHWVRPPETSYFAPFESWDGAQVSFNAHTGNWTHGFILGTGGSSGDIAGSDVDADLYLLSWIGEIESTRLKATITHMEIDFLVAGLDTLVSAFESAGSDILELSGNYLYIALGYNFDNGRYLVASEFNQVKADNVNVLGAEFEIFYVSFGYRWKRMTFHYTWDHVEASEKSKDFMRELDDDLAAIGLSSLSPLIKPVRYRCGTRNLPTPLGFATM